MQNLLILGAGQYGMVAKEIAESMRKYDHIDFLDDNNPIAVGKLGDFENLSNVYDSAVVGGYYYLFTWGPNAVGNDEQPAVVLIKQEG